MKANEFINESGTWSPRAQQGVAEGLNESAIFLNPNAVIVGQQHGKPLDLSPETLKQVQAIAAKHGAWYEGNGADRAYTRGVIDRYMGSFDDEVAKTASPDDPKWIYVLFANVDANNRVQRVGVDPEQTIFDRLMATAKDNSFQGIGYTEAALKKFLSMCSEGKYDFVAMSQQPATKPNLTRFLKAGEALMWPSNWDQYPNKAGKIARAATVLARDQYLASRRAGVYVVGSGHLKAVQDISGKQGVAEEGYGNHPSQRVDPRTGKKYVPPKSPLGQGVAEGSEKRCMQCGMKNCKCPGDSCKCKPIAGWIPGQGFKKAMDEAASAELVQEFDLIENIIEGIAAQNGVDAEAVWADLESLTEDELYAFAVTSQLNEDWQKANKSDRTSGMSQKAVNAYRREHPGSKLQTAVTTKPGKLKKGSKASKRRKSYCSRSRGQMKMHNISCAKTPDKAICKARRRWNC